MDEINWWPLVFPIKCRALMFGEARLAGPDKNILHVCSQSEIDTFHSGRFKTYAWILPSEARTLEAIEVKGAHFNRWLKNNTLDWGFADAIMSVGSMHDLFREGIPAIGKVGEI